MKEWLRKYWPVLALAIGGVIVLIYLKSRQASTTGTNQLAATLPMWGSGGGGGVVFQPTPDIPGTSPDTPPPVLPPGQVDLQGTPSGYQSPVPPGYDVPTWLPIGWIQPGPVGPIGSSISGVPLTLGDDYTDLVRTVSPMSEAAHSGYEIK